MKTINISIELPDHKAELLNKYKYNYASNFRMMCENDSDRLFMCEMLVETKKYSEEAKYWKEKGWI